MNKSYFGKDRPTNVISFSYMNGFSCEVIGDIAISLEKAKEEAEDADCHFYERIFALIIHGILHILGFDHENGKNESRRMKYREKKLMAYVRSHDLFKKMVIKDQQCENC
jgi:probable rRNA maturation factor